jgi:hypothetical protein
MASAPFPLLEDCLNHVRVSVNDAIVSLGGQTLKDTAAFTPYYANRGYQMLQQELVNLGYPPLIVEGFVILNLPAVSNPDTALQVTLSWDGYSDGVTPYPSVVLPQTLIRPLRLAERLSGQSPNSNQFWDMSGPEQGVTRIPPLTKDFRNRIWVWNRAGGNPTGPERIAMPGATGLIDLRADFASFLPDFTGTGNTFPGDQVVPIMRSTDALAWAIGYNFSFARNDDPAICSYARDEFRRAAAIIAGAKLPAQTVQVTQ